MDPDPGWSIKNFLLVYKYTSYFYGLLDQIFFWGTDCLHIVKINLDPMNFRNILIYTLYNTLFTGIPRIAGGNFKILNLQYLEWL